MPRWFRKACNLPISPRVSHGKLSSHDIQYSVGRVQRIKSFGTATPHTLTRLLTINPPACSAFHALLMSLSGHISLVRIGRDRNVARFEKFGHGTTLSYCYESQPEHRFESVATAHTAADLRVTPGPQTALVGGPRGHREQNQETTMRASPQRI
jgi:hypothetical protein